jgi:glycosyltransferase involved in cell wall biosynthesis
LRISIILPVYNGEKYLATSIESCLNQTYKNIELIIVNDCSTDNSLQIMNLYAEKDERITIINNEENQKLPASLNIGHKAAKGDLITWTSDDNFYELDALEIMINEIFTKKVDIVYANFFLIDDKGDRIKKVKLLGLENIIFGNFISCCFLYTKEVFARNIAYNEDLFLAEDYDFWLRALLHSRYAHIERSLYHYRIHQTTLTNQITINKEKNQLWKKSVAKMYANFSSEISKVNNEEISEFFTQNLINEKINFSWIININKKIKDFKETLKTNDNFREGKLLDKVFLNKLIELMLYDRSSISNFSKSLFIVKEYFFILDYNAIKTLVKHSFFK